MMNNINLVNMLIGITFCIMDIVFLYVWTKLFSKKLTKQKMEIKKMESDYAYLKLEERYYKDLDQLHEQYDVFLHDIRHMMRTIAALSQEGNCEEIGSIVENMRTSLGKMDEKIICGNKILNALLNERKSYADSKGATLELEIIEPLYFRGIDDIDLITLVGNVLDNAIEAEIHSLQKGGVTCTMNMARNGYHMIIQVENSYEPESVSKTKMLERREKIGDKHGIGLKSVNEIVSKYGGIFERRQNDGRYNVKIILPVQGGWKEEQAYTDKDVSVYAQSVYK